MEIKKFILIFVIFHLLSIEIYSRNIIIQVIDTNYKGSLSKIYCKDTNNCIIFYQGIGDINTKLICNRFIRTTDGGKSWFCASIDCPAWQYDSIINNYIFVDRNKLKCLSYNNNEELTAIFDCCQIGRSKDYGKTWLIEEKDSIFDYFKIEDLAIIFKEGQNILAYTNSIPIGQGSGYGRVFISDSNYRNWKNIPIPDSLNIFNIYSITNFNESFFILHGTFANRKYFFSKTEDNGKNWTTCLLQLPSDTTYGCSMFFLNDSVGWITAYYKYKGGTKISVFFTNDKGNNWEIISEFNCSIYKKLLFYNQMEGIILDYNGGYITNDGGKTWELLTYNDSEYFRPYMIMSFYIIKKNEFLCTSRDNGIIFKLIIPDE